jgi:histidine triad (HIT) family protein
VPVTVPDRVPCSYCENFAGRYPWHGPPAVIYEDEELYVFLAPAPLGGMPGHTLVCPKRHVETIFDLTDDEAALLGVAVSRAARMVRDVVDPAGVLVQQHNGEAAFQTVPHLHFHVIPKVDDSPFPPTEWLDVMPAEERAELAAQLGSHWNAAP